MTDAVELRAARIAENEARFRERNELVEDVALALAGPEGQLAFGCECADESCSRAIRMSGEEYERVRANPHHFLVYPGHELVEYEQVVFSNSRFAVVEKIRESARRVAEERNPRR